MLYMKRCRVLESGGLCVSNCVCVSDMNVESWRGWGTGTEIAKRVGGT